MKNQIIFLLSSLFVILCFSCKKAQLDRCCSNDFIYEYWDSSLIIIPNAFSPNGDGINDLFRAITDSSASMSYLKINNRGKTIYESGSNLTWDGTDLNGKTVSEGTYTYVINLNKGADTKTFEGTICLFRTTCPDKGICKFENYLLFGDSQEFCP